MKLSKRVTILADSIIDPPGIRGERRQKNDSLSNSLIEKIIEDNLIKCFEEIEKQVETHGLEFYLPEKDLKQIVNNIATKHIRK